MLNTDDFLLFDDSSIGSDSSSFLDELNEKQKEAVLYTDGPILVLAGAGSGKTRVLTRRVANLVLNNGVYPSQILAVTFTNKATSEMLTRLSSLLGGHTNSLWVCTFHSMSVRILRRYAEYLGYTNSFSIYDTKDSQSLIKKICKDFNIDEKKYSPEYIRGRISFAKNNFISPSEFNENINTNRPYNLVAQEQVVSKVYKEYQNQLKSLNSMDFDDLLLNVYNLLKTQEEVLHYYQDKFHYILVDEFQDTNEVQYKIMYLLAKERKNIFVVGDDDQSIYSFRGAKPSNISMFEKDFSGTKIIKLEQNYRSTSNILDASNSIISQNKCRKEKKLWTQGEKGELITLYCALDEFSEARYVAEEIKKLVDSGKYKYRDIACFYRTNAQSRALEEALMTKKILYRIYGTLKFWDRKEIKDIISYLRLVINQDDDQSFLRVVNTPNRGIGAQTVSNLIQKAKEHHMSLFNAAKMLNNSKLDAFITLINHFKERSNDVSLPKLLETIYEESTYKARLAESKDPAAESRVENILELIAYAQTISKGESDNEKAISVFMDKVSLAGSDESYESKNANDENISDTVSLMTVHLAKGLEFPVVFFTGLEEGLVPHSKSFDSTDDIEEERRLCYVGMTRAMKKLYLTSANKRSMFGNSNDLQYRKQSRFLKDIPLNLLDRITQENTAVYDDFKNDGYLKDSNLDYDININYNDSSNFDFLPSMFKKKLDKKFEKKNHDKMNVLNLVHTASELGEPIGNFRKLDLSEVKTGLRVRHPNFGDGIIRDIQGSLTSNNPFKIKLCIDFDNIEEQKKLILGKACFEIIE